MVATQVYPRYDRTTGNVCGFQIAYECSKPHSHYHDYRENFDL